MTPPPAIVALMRESNSSSPRIASCKWRGVIRFTFKSFDAFPANSSTSAVRYSRMAALYTAAVAPTRPWLVVLYFRCRWTRTTGNCKPALCERETAFVLAFPESFPALPPAISNSAEAQTSKAEKGLVRHPARTRRLLLRRTAIQTAGFLVLNTHHVNNTVP